MKLQRLVSVTLGIVLSGNFLLSAPASFAQKNVAQKTSDQKASTQPCQEPPTFSGEWTSNWGPMRLTVQGGQVVGQYTHDQGRIQGTLSADGRTFTAYWAESPSYKAPKDAGRAILTLSADGHHFSGKWGYGNDLNQGDWTGDKPRSTSCMPSVPRSQMPQSQTPEEKPARFVIQPLKIDDSVLRSKKYDVETEMNRVQQAIQSQKSTATQFIRQFESVRKSLEQAKQAKLQADQQVIQKQAEIDQLANPPQVIPDRLKTMVAQRDFLKQEVQKAEDRVLSLKSQPSELPLAVSQLDSLQAQLTQIEGILKDRLPKPPNNTSRLQQARNELLTLENAYWDRVKEEYRLLSDLDSATRLSLSALDELDRLKDQLLALEKQKRMLDAKAFPVLESIQVQADAQAVYRARWQGPPEQLEKLEKELNELKSVTAELKRWKDEALADYKAQAQVASDQLTQLHGTSVSQGNGLWSTLKDVVNNDGAIFDNARGQAAVDFGMNAYEVFVEGWGRGGPVGAIVETLHKAALAGAEYGLDAGSTQLANASLLPPSSNPVIAEANKNHAADLKEPLSSSEVLKTGLMRALEDGLTRHVRDLGNQLGVNTAHRLAIPDRLAFYNMMSDASVDPKVLRAQGERLKQHSKRVNELGKAKAYSLKSLGASALKDAIKVALKTYFQEQENSAWESFLLAEAAQVNLFYAYQALAEKYWQAYDKLDAVQQQYNGAVMGYDPNTGFKVLSNQDFPEKARLTIQIQLKEPAGHQERIIIGGVSAQPVSQNSHQFSLPASALPRSAQGPASRPTPVELLIQHVE